MKLPSVAAYFVLSIDGKVAAPPLALSSTGHCKRLVDLRAGADAVLVGQGGLDADAAARGLSAKIRAKRKRAGQTAEPLRVVFSNSGRIRQNLPIFRTGGGSVVVFTTKSMSAPAKKALEKFADVHVEPRGKSVDLRRALRILARDYGVRSALCESEAALFRSLLDAGLVRKLHITFVPAVIGGASAPTLLGSPHSSLLRRSIPLDLEKFSPRGGEVFATYRLTAGSKP